MTGRITLMDSTGETWFQPEPNLNLWRQVNVPCAHCQMSGPPVYFRETIEHFWGPVVEVVEPASALTPKEEQ